MLVIFEATKQIQRRAMELWVERQGQFLGFYLYPFEAILVPSRILKASPGNIREQQHYRKPRKRLCELLPWFLATQPPHYS